MTQRSKAPIRPPSARELRHLRELVGVSQTELALYAGYAPKTIYRWESGDGTPRRAVMEVLRGLQKQSDDARKRGRNFRFVDLFAGIGGTRRGFESAGGRCVFSSEWNKYSQVTYRANFGTDEPIAGDITKVLSSQIPPHDVLLAGFPCQPFSIAGVSKSNALGRPHGFACTTQGSMFFEVARIIRDLRPKAFVLENVKNLARHDSGKTLDTILKVLERDLGYRVQLRTIDARVVVPQHRERIFLVGFREPTKFLLEDVAFPVRERPLTLRSILHREDGSELTEESYTGIDGRVLEKYYITDNLWTYLQRYAQKHRAKGNGFGFSLVGPEDVARTLSARYWKDGSEILVRTHRRTPRRLTPRECARLMGFDSLGRVPFRIPVSDTQAYRQFGNSVVVPVVEAIARAMRPYLV